MPTREAVQIVTAHRQREGAGFIVRRPFPTSGFELADPFLLLDEMGPADYAPGEAVGAPDHPHRGFETVTYMLEGEFEHEDSAGHRGDLRPGDVQWMTAGAGIVHSEMPSRRIREEGVAVYGFGERKTPTSFVSACDRFIYTEILRKTPKAAVAPSAATPDKPAGRGRRGRSAKPDTKDLPVAALRDAVEASADETGWAHLGQVGTLVGKRLPDFDPRNFGHKNFSSLMEAAGGFELQRRGDGGGRPALREGHRRQCRRAELRHAQLLRGAPRRR